MLKSTDRRSDQILLATRSSYFPENPLAGLYKTPFKYTVDSRLSTIVTPRHLVCLPD